MDAPVLPDPLSQIPEDQEIGSVTAPYRDHAAHDPAGHWTAPTTHANAMMPLPTARSRCHTASQECEAVKDRHRWSHGLKRGPARREIPWPCALATMERIPPPEPRREEDALCETVGPKPSYRQIAPQSPAGRGMARDLDRQVATSRSASPT